MQAGAGGLPSNHRSPFSSPVPGTSCRSCGMRWCWDQMHQKVGGPRLPLLVLFRGMSLQVVPQQARRAFMDGEDGGCYMAVLLAPQSPSTQAGWTGMICGGWARAAGWRVSCGGGRRTCGRENPPTSSSPVVSGSAHAGAAC